MRIILAILIWVAAAGLAPAAITVTPGGGGGVITTNEFDGSAITSGTVADARIASTIARDSEVPAIMATNTFFGPFDGHVFPQALYSQFGYPQSLLTAGVNPVNIGEMRVPCVTRNNGRVFVYYCAQLYDTASEIFDRGAIYCATGTSFESLEYPLYELGTVVPCFTNSSPGKWDSGHVWSPRVIQYNNTNWMFYLGGTNTDGFVSIQPQDSIGLAYSTDGTNFTRYGSSPILQRGTGKDWDNFALYSAFPIQKEDGTWMLFYDGFTNGAVVNIGFATAPSITGPWTKYASNPVVVWQSMSNWTQRIAQVPSIVRDRNGYTMCFQSFDDGNPQEQITFATSKNLTNWVVVEPRPIPPTNSNTGHLVWTFSPYIFMDGGTPRIMWEDNSTIYLSTPAMGSTFSSQSQSRFGFGSFAPNSDVVKSTSGLTNTSGVNITAWLTGATALSLTNASGEVVFYGATVTTLTPITIQPGGKLKGSSITYPSGSAVGSW